METNSRENIYIGKSMKEIDEEKIIEAAKMQMLTTS